MKSKGQNLCHQIQDHQGKVQNLGHLLPHWNGNLEKEKYPRIQQKVKNNQRKDYPKVHQKGRGQNLGQSLHHIKRGQTITSQAGEEVETEERFVSQ